MNKKQDLIVELVSKYLKDNHPLYGVVSVQPPQPNWLVIVRRSADPTHVKREISVFQDQIEAAVASGKLGEGIQQNLDEAIITDGGPISSQHP